MSVKPIIWKEGRHGILHGYVGGIRLFGISYNLTNREGGFVLGSRLPQVGRRQYPTEEECKEKAQQTLETFIHELTEEASR